MCRKSCAQKMSARNFRTTGGGLWSQDICVMIFDEKVGTYRINVNRRRLGLHVFFSVACRVKAAEAKVSGEAQQRCSNYSMEEYVGLQQPNSTQKYPTTAVLRSFWKCRHGLW